jgi:4-hydroxybenzoate polyprenyltransferase
MKGSIFLRHPPGGWMSGLLFGTLRVQRTFPTVVAAGASLYLQGVREAESMVLYPLSIFFFHISASAFNDVSDVEVDRVNAPDRLLPRGRMSRARLAAFASLLFILGVGLSLVVDPVYALLAGTLGLLYVLLYSFFVPMKSHPVGSLLYLSASGLAIPFAGASVITRSVNGETLMLFLLLTALGGCATISSVKDVLGDGEEGRRTFAVVLGFARASEVPSKAHVRRAD